MRYLLLAVVSFSCSIVFAQTATVKGVVRDELSQLPIAHAVARLTGTGFSDTTKEDGSFRLPNVPYGKYTVEIVEEGHTTFSEPVDVNEPEVVVGSVGLSISEQEVERSDRHDKANAEDNLPTVTISDNDLINIGAQNIAGVLASTHDAFISTTTFINGSAHFRIRGYDPGEFMVYLNGVPVNDLERGTVPSQSWSGLNNVMRNRAWSLGLGASDFGFGGVGGSYNLDATASSLRKELEVAYSNANRNFSHRLMATYSTGVLSSGWAVSVSFSRRWAEQGYVPGTFYDGYSYYLSVDKHFGTDHVLSFTTFGAPTREGKDVATTQEAYNLAGSNYYNPGWGYQNGVVRNGYVSNTFQPMFVLNHKWKIDSKSNLQTAASFSFGKKMNSSVDYYNAPDPQPDYYKNMPSYITDSVTRAFSQQQWRQNVNVRQINWDNFYATNRHNFVTVDNVDGIAGNNKIINESNYIVGNKVQNQQHFNFNTTYHTNLTENIDLTAGAYYQYELSENYRQVADLLGGQYWLNSNHYAQLDYPGNANAAQNDLNHPNQLLTVGDKYGYDYKYVNHHAVGWIQPRFHYGKLDFFAAAQVLGSAYWRNGLYRNGLFPDDSYGKSSVISFLNYAFKAGLAYNFDGKNILFANGAYLTKAPDIVDAFQSSETRNHVVANLHSEQVYSVEAGYQYKGPIVKARATFYYTQRNNHTQNINFYDNQLYTDINFAMTGISIRNIGAEAVVEAKLYKGFSALAIANIGRDFYTSRPTATVTDNNTNTVLYTNETIYQKNYNVGGIPQLACTFGLNYHSPQFWFVDVYFNYYDWMWVSSNPARLTAQAVANTTPGTPNWDYIIGQERLPAQFTMDVLMGYSWLMNNQFKGIKKHKYYMVFSLNVANITNNKNFIVHGYEQNSFNFSTSAFGRYPTKYTYMYGANYLLTVAFRMN